MSFQDERVFYYDDLCIEPEAASKLLTLWRDRCHKNARAHYRSSETMYRRSGYLTVSNTVFSISILFFINASWIQDMFFKNASAKPIYTMLAGVAGLLLVLTTILQYIYRLEERGRDHKSAGSEFANLQRKIERYLTGKIFRMSVIHNINREYNYITRIYPLVPSKVWRNSEFSELSGRISTIERDPIYRSEEKNVDQ